MSSRGKELAAALVTNTAEKEALRLRASTGAEDSPNGGAAASPAAADSTVDVEPASDDEPASERSLGLD